MKILLACESSGIVRDAFRERGHDAWSCDLLPCEGGNGYHIQADVFGVIANHDWEMMIGFPPCTYLCSSGLHWNKRRPERAQQTEDALEFALGLATCDIPKIAIENPIGCLSTRWRKPDQIIQPYHFGHDASKATCLWLKNLPELVHTEAVEPRLVESGGKIRSRWGNQTDSGQNKLGPSEDRWKERARTYKGIAWAMSEQWG
jgi:hypothetical protein